MPTLEGLWTALFSHYGPQGWWPLLERDRETDAWSCVYRRGDYTVPQLPQQRFEIGVGAILTQNSTWSGALRALINLKKANRLNPASLGDHTLADEIRSHIRCSGFFNQKQERLANWAIFTGELGERIPERSELLAQKGIGPETADSILLYAFGRPCFISDAYALRICSRISGVQWNYASLAERMEGQLDSHSAVDKLRILTEGHALFVAHGKRCCRARPICERCFLKGRCLHGINSSSGLLTPA